MGNIQTNLVDFGKTKKETKKNTKKPRKRKKGKCKTYLEQKIALSLSEYKKGNSIYQTRQQAIASAYSQVKKEHPHCKRVFKKK